MTELIQTGGTKIKELPLADLVYLVSALGVSPAEIKVTGVVDYDAAKISPTPVEIRETAKDRQMVAALEAADKWNVCDPPTQIPPDAVAAIVDAVRAEEPAREEADDLRDFILGPDVALTSKAYEVFLKIPSYKVSELQERHRRSLGLPQPLYSGKGRSRISIMINKSNYAIDREPPRVTGAQIKGLPVGYDTSADDLFLAASPSGYGDDQLVADDDELELTDGMVFFTAPRQITGG